MEKKNPQNKTEERYNKSGFINKPFSCHLTNNRVCYVSEKASSRSHSKSRMCIHLLQTIDAGACRSYKIFRLTIILLRKCVGAALFTFAEKSHSHKATACSQRSDAVKSSSALRKEKKKNLINRSSLSLATFCSLLYFVEMPAQTVLLLRSERSTS